MEAELASLRLRAQNASSDSDEQRARLDELQSEVDSAEALVADARARETATEAEIAELTVEVERRRSALSEMLSNVIAE